ncbi:hypothetical protein NQD34_016064 [Periophthalmus magnuspinnatus]|nr:hypothetical protein NQD34_016064 [Periophthalmus magnuspinnatus]
MKGDIKAEIDSHCKEIRNDIAAVRRQTKADIENTRGELMERVDKLFTMHKETASAQKDTEESLNDQSDRLVVLENLYQSLVNDHKKLKEKCTDLENRSRRQNIQIVGVEEGAEANNTVSFMAKFLMEMLGEENFDRAIV